MTQAEWEKPEPCPKIARAAMFMRKFDEKNTTAPSWSTRPGRFYPKSLLDVLKMHYTAARDLLLKAAGKVGATKEEREKEKEDISVAVELLLLLLSQRKQFPPIQDVLPSLTQYERKLARLKYAGFIADSPSLFSVDDIRWLGFIPYLNQKATEDAPHPGKTLFDLLPQRVRTLIETLNGVKIISQENQSVIINALNKVLERRDFYREEDYSNIMLPEEVQKLLQCNRNDLSLRETQKLNRILIETSFSQGIEQSHKGDIRDWRKFCEKLANDAQSKKPNPGKVIWKHLSPKVQRLISKTASGTEIQEDEEQSILEEFNEVLERRDFYQAEDYQGIPLPAKVQDILGSPLFSVSHILSWPRFISKLSEAAREDAPSPGKTIYNFLPDEMQRLVRRSTTRPPTQWEQKQDILPENIKSRVRLSLTRIRIETQERRDLTDALNRYILGSPLFTVGDILDWSYFCSKFSWDVKKAKEEEKEEDKEEDKKEEGEKAKEDGNEGKEEDDFTRQGKVIWDLFPSGVQSLIKNWSVDTKVARKEKSDDIKVVEDDVSGDTEVVAEDEPDKVEITEEDQSDDIRDARKNKPDEEKDTLKKKSAKAELSKEEKSQRIINSLNSILNQRNLNEKLGCPSIGGNPIIKELLECDRNSLSLQEIQTLNRFLIESIYEPSLFSVGDILDRPGFLTKLNQDASQDTLNPGKRIWNNSPQEIQSSIRDLAEPSLFYVGDIFDWFGFCSKLNRDQEKNSPNPGKRIWQLFPKEIQSLIKKLTADTKPPDQDKSDTKLSDQDKSDIVNVLNEILERRDFYREEDYCGTDIRENLPEKVRESLSRNRDDLSTKEIRRLNRLLIKTTYSKQIAKSHLTGAHLKDEDKSDIINILNNLLDQRDFHQEEDYLTTGLPEKAQTLLTRNRDELSTEEIRRLNRLLIEITYPGKIAKNPIYPCEIAKIQTGPRDFYNEHDYSTEDLPERVQTLLARDQEDLSAEEIHKRNRLLIETTFPDEVAESQYFSDDREDLPLREVQTFNRWLMEAAYPEIVRHERRDHEVAILSYEHYVLWWIYQAREIAQSKTYRRERALNELFKEFNPFFEEFVEDKLFDIEEYRVLKRKEIWKRLEFACWQGIRSYSSDKGKPVEDYVAGNYMAFEIHKTTRGKGRGSAHLRISDIKHWTSFLFCLDMAREIDQPYPEKRIWMLLPRSVQTLIEELCSEVEIKQKHQSQIIKTLNAILDREDFYSKDYFPRTSLPEDLIGELERSRSGLSLSDIRWLNRRVLESIFPYEIEKKEQPKTTPFSKIARKVAEKTGQDQFSDIAQIFPREMSTDEPDMREGVKEYIRKAALENISLVYEGDQKANLIDVLDVALDQAFGGETPTGDSICEDERITMCRASVYNYLHLLGDILGPLLND